nr:EpsG family protein [Bifidobacterium longum]
ITGWLGVEFTVISPNIDRIFLYEKIFTILFIPNILFSNKLLEKTLQFLFLLWGAAYFSYLVIYGGWYEVYPYTSEILGI